MSATFYGYNHELKTGRPRRVDGVSILFYDGQHITGWWNAYSDRTWQIQKGFKLVPLNEIE